MKKIVDERAEAYAKENFSKYPYLSHEALADAFRVGFNGGYRLARRDAVRNSVALRRKGKG